MGWDVADQALKGDWLKWADAPFDVRFTSDPDVQHGEYKGKPSTQFVFDVATRDGDKKLGLSRRAMHTLRPLKEKHGAAFSKIAFRCHRYGTGTDTKYEFEQLAANAEPPPPPPADPFPPEEGDPGAAPDDDLPF